MTQVHVATMPPAIEPQVTWTPVPPPDVLSAARSVGGVPQMGRLISYKGTDVDTQLGWAFSELEAAERASSHAEQQKHTTHAVSHAKRAVDCLFDAYLERDFLAVHLTPRPTFSAKLDLLKVRFKQHLAYRTVSVGRHGKYGGATAATSARTRQLPSARARA
jgi:hypothetical protein